MAPPPPILPEWVQWFAALAPAGAALVTASVAVAVAIVSFRQWQVARHKLQLDLFERRFTIFMDARSVISELTQLGKVSDAGLPNEIIARGRFLFGPEVLEIFQELHSLNTDYVVGRPKSGSADALLARLSKAIDPYLQARQKV